MYTNLHKTSRTSLWQVIDYNSKNKYPCYFKTFHILYEMNYFIFNQIVYKTLITIRQTFVQKKLFQLVKN